MTKQGKEKWKTANILPKISAVNLLNKMSPEEETDFQFHLYHCENCHSQT